MYPTLESTVGNTPLVRLLRIPGDVTNVVLGKLEGNNPAGSVKDRPALSMIVEAEKRGDIKPGDTLIEPTSGNTGIALAMVAAMKGYRMILVMPDHLSVERRQAMRAYGAELVLTPKAGGMERARDIADADARRGQGHHPRPVREPGQSARALSRHRVPRSGAIRAGRSRTSCRRWERPARSWACRAFSRRRIPAIPIVGAQPEEGSQIPGHPQVAGSVPAEDLRSGARRPRSNRCRRPTPRTWRAGLRREEGIFGGISAGGACAVALRIAREVANATIVFVVCDRGDRYLSTGVFPG